MNTKYDSESALDVETFPKAFDWYLRAVRQPRTQIARILHCSVDTLNKWRTGEKLPTGEQLEKLKRLMGVKHADELNIPLPKSWQTALLDGLSIEEWRKRALVAEMRLRKLQKETMKEQEAE